MIRKVCIRSRESRETQKSIMEKYGNPLKMLFDAPARGRRWILWGFGGIFLASYYLHFSLPALFATFAPDDIMNLRYYWFQGAWKTIGANVNPWTSFYRPFGGIYYLSLYAIFDLDPFPFRVVSMLLLGINAFLAYRLAAQLLNSRGKAFLVCFLFVYHPALVLLFFTNSYIYDVLCGTFFLSALSFYLAKRQGDSRLKPCHSAAFLCMCLFALKSKEMAVSLPLLVLCYELIVKKPSPLEKLLATSRKIKSLAQRILLQGKPAMLGALLSLMLIGSITLGPDAMTKSEAYRPVFTWGRFLDANSHYLNELFEPASVFNQPKLLLVWGAILVYAFWRKDVTLKFLWCWIFITPWPIAFLPARGGGCLYIVMAGWAMVVVHLLADLAAFLGGEVRFKHLPSFKLMMPLILLAMLFWGIKTTKHLHDALPVLLRNGDKTMEVIQEIQAFNFKPPPGSKILLTDEPFESFNTVFIAELVWNEKDLTVLSQSHSKLDAQDQSRMDYILSFKNCLHFLGNNRTGGERIH